MVHVHGHKFAKLKLTNEQKFSKLPKFYPPKLQAILYVCSYVLN